jgi:cob(I)alamin adenosyltransferase
VSKRKNKSKRKRKALGEEPLAERGLIQNRHLVSKRRVSGEDPYAWIEGKEGKKRMKKKPGRPKKAKPGKRRKPSKLKVRRRVKRRVERRVERIPKKPKLPAKIWNRLKKVEKEAVLLPKEIMTAAKATGKVAGKITTDFSKTIASGVVAGPKEAKKIIRRVQVKVKAGHLKSRMEELFGILGEKCYRLADKKRAIVKEKRIQNLIKRIKNCQKELQKIEKKI